MPWESGPDGRHEPDGRSEPNWQFPWHEEGRYNTPAGIDRVRQNIQATMEADPRRQAEILEYSNRLAQIGIDLRERAYKLEAEIANEKIRQNEETSKSLMMAGREDQLRAALMARFAGMGGKLTADSFQFLDEATKRSIMNFSPDLLPREIRTPLRGLEDERALNLKSQEEVESKQREAQRWLEEQQRRQNPGANSAPTPAPQITPPPITLNFSDQFQAMARLVAGVVQHGLQNQINEMRGAFMGLVASASANSALRAGASAVG
jgi:hypothetical protein